MSCGCQCTCPSTASRVGQATPNYTNLSASKLVSKPGMSLRFLRDAVATMEIVDVAAEPESRRPALAVEAVGELK